MTDSQFTVRSLEKRQENREISPYLKGFYQKDIPWWPFILFGIITAIALGAAINLDLGFSPAYIPVGIAGLFVAFLILQKPEIGAYILIISVFTSISDILTDRGLPAINRPLIAITIGSVLVNYLLKTGKYNHFPNLTKSEWGLIGYYIAIVISVLVVPDKSDAVDTIVEITKDILVGLCIFATLNSQEKWVAGAKTLVFTMGVLAALGVIKTLTGTEATFFDLARNSLFGQVGADSELRYGGPIGEPNLWGQVLVSTLPFAIYLARYQSSFKRSSLFVAIGALLLLAMIFTGSRGALVALIIIAPLTAIDMKIKLHTFLTGVLLFIGLFAILPENYAKRFGTLNIFADQSELTQDEAVSGRQSAMQIGMGMFLDNPITGVGFGNYRANYWEYAEKLGLESNANNVDKSTDAQYPHSLYIEILSETGLIGFGAFSLFMATLFASLYQVRRKFKDIALYREWTLWNTALMMSILTFLISGFFLHGVFFRFIWALIGLAMGAISISNDIRPIPYIRWRNRQ